VMQIYRAENGELFQVNKTLQDIERYCSLEYFLHQVTGVDEAAVLAYLSDGRRLRDENLRELAGSADQAIFVFNKHYLDYELEDVLMKLRIEPSMHPFKSDINLGDIDALATAALSHCDFIFHIFSTIQVQHEALRIASTSLDLNVLSISDVFDGFASNARRELEKQAGLLQGLDLDLDAISKIRIHSDFLSPAVRKAVETGEKARTLGDYVSNVKMRQVGDVCAKTHNELSKRFNTAEDTMTRLSTGADDIRASVVNSGLVGEADKCTKRAQEALERITHIKTQLQEPRIDESDLLSEIGKLDMVLRDELRLIVDLKNKSTALCIRALRHISHLNNDLMVLPQILSTLQSDFRAKTNFSHIERLHKMLYAYGATLVEIVRRKEFARFFSQRAQTIAEIMAKLSANERKQRQIYRGEVHGQLPFDAKGMDDAVPAVEMTSTGVGIINYTIERGDLMMLLEEIDKMEQSQNSTDLISQFNVNSLGETRSRLEKLIIRMDSLETTFDKMAEKTSMSWSDHSSCVVSPTDHTDSEFQELVEQFHELQDTKTEQERQFEDDRHHLQTEIDHLHAELLDAQGHAAREGQLITQLEDQLHQEQVRGEEAVQKGRELETREVDLQAEVESQRNMLSDAEAERASQAKIIEELQRDLLKAKSESQENKRLEMEASAKVMQLISEKELLSRTLESVQTRQVELEGELVSSRRDVGDLRKRLSDASDETDRRLRVQVSESDRMLRDVIAEADGDRAVLEHQCFEMTAMIQAAERQLKESKLELDVLNADISGLREELQRTEHELGDMRHMETVLRDELHAADDTISDYRMRLEECEHISKELLRVAASFRDSHCRAFAATQPSSSSSSRSLANLADSTSALIANLKPYVEPPPIDYENISDGLQILSEYEATTSALPDAVAKMASTIRKWQKQCKEYRDRAKGKISFRNFAKGDLALFLPTRNSISKPWAAFNVSFPHYFLQAAGNLAEQLKTREWIVARITSIAEQIVDPRDPSTNPYGLSDGTKFYMLQVEDWTQSTSSRRKSSSSPLARLSSTSPLARPSSRPSSPLVRPSSPSLFRRPSSPLARPASPPPSRRSSPFVSPIHINAQAHPSSPLASQSPFPSTSNPIPSPSPVNPNPSPSPSSAALPLHNPKSRRSSSSSRFSISRSNIFSPGRHPLGGKTGNVKGVATTAVSTGVATVPDVADTAAALSIRSPGIETDIETAVASPLDRRRTLSSVSRSSPLNVPSGDGSSALASLAESLGWKGSTGRRERRESHSGMPSPSRSSPTQRESSRRESHAHSHSRSQTSPHSSPNQRYSPQNPSSIPSSRRGASEILRRFDDILPQER
ncbi:hypothetical protein BU17DRAFT_39351, partial [Hysterangium stoloniferum]